MSLALKYSKNSGRTGKQGITAQQLFISFAVILILLLLAVVPSFALQITSFAKYHIYDLQRGLQIFLLSSVVLFVVANVSLRKLWLETYCLLSVKMRTLMALFFILAFTSAFFAINSRFMALLEVLHFVLLLNVVIFVAAR